MKNISYKDFKFDNILILSTIAKIGFERNPTLNNDEELVLHAIKRSKSEFSSLNITEIGEKISTYDETQMLGFSNNVKGILHELQFVEIENEDGDNITASVFADTNHKGTDIMLTDDETGEILEVQLKATDDVAYVNDWIEEYPDGEILVTDEIANKMNLETTEISNEKLTTNVEDFVDRIIESSDKDEFWEYMPFLPTISIAIVGFTLFQRYRKKEITFQIFKYKFIKLTGIKLTKFALVSGLMAIPGLNVVTGATILFLTLNNYGKLIKRYVA